MSEPAPFLHIRAGEGRKVSAFGDEVLFKLTSEDTGGQFMLGLSRTAPGGGPPFHVHHREDEIFIIVAGVYEITTHAGAIRAEPGDIVYARKDTPHTFKVVSETEGMTWILTFPAGFDKFFTECGEEFKGGAPDMGRIMEIFAKHNLEILPPPA